MESRSIGIGEYDVVQRPLVVEGRRVDYWLLGAVWTLLALGVVMVLDASFFVGQERYGDGYAMVRRHVVSIGLATLVAIQVGRLELATVRRLAVPMLIALLVLLALVAIPGIGQVRNGARRWLDLRILSFEPSEMFKPILVAYLADSLARKRERMRSFGFGVLPHLVVAGVGMALLIAEPDFGALVLTGLVTLAMLFAGGARTGQLLALGAAALPGVVALVLREPYRVARVLAFRDPWGDAQEKGFQLVQSLLAIGSGGVLGVGLGNSKQKLFYLPEGHTDFIFALIGEELGFIGVLVVVGCFATIAVRGFRVAVRTADPFASLLAFGLTFLLVAQAVVNLGVVLGLLPTKGLALPLLSFGGSAMLANGLTVGLLLGLSREVR